jgi:hypothetical protein
VVRGSFELITLGILVSAGPASAQTSDQDRFSYLLAAIGSCC